MTAYIGSGPYCYSNALAMMLAGAPPVGVIETLTGAPFGAQIESGIPFFDPIGWHPEIGIDTAVELLGWSCVRTDGGSEEEALERLRGAVARGPVLAGPLELGLLTYRPDSGIALGADHYVVVLAVDGDTVVLHDPQGHPHASLPTKAFLESWRGEQVTYIDTPFVLRAGFVRHRSVSAVEALESALPRAIRWLDGASAAIEQLAAMVEEGLDPEIRHLLGIFGIRLGARRLLDASVSLKMLGRTASADIAAHQSRLVGALQYPLVMGDDTALAAILRRLSPTYAQLRDALAG
ncbi:hypothetical protein [Nocardia sp. NPDC052566]|uniref:hypothetical protein n=1 Tax=Nocardia sp. NPDC052566 TaxID=3364330 RepID=UPI0037CB02E2